jgi:hypothetical protein
MCFCPCHVRPRYIQVALPETGGIDIDNEQQMPHNEHSTRAQNTPHAGAHSHELPDQPVSQPDTAS